MIFCKREPNVVLECQMPTVEYYEYLRVLHTQFIHILLCEQGIVDVFCFAVLYRLQIIMQRFIQSKMLKTQINC